MKPWTRVFLYVCTLPTDLLGWALTAILGAAWGTRPTTWTDGVLLATVKRDSWLGRTFSAWGAETAGHAIVVFDDQDASTLVHEQTHVKQLEGNGLLGLAVGLALVWWSWPIALVAWITMPWLVYLAAGLCGLLRGEGFYRGNGLEVAAYDHAGNG